jgi:uncharacterized protein Yka (UPF0111/DUF47 family)
MEGEAANASPHFTRKELMNISDIREHLVGAYNTNKELALTVELIERLDRIANALENIARTLANPTAPDDTLLVTTKEAQ